MQLLAYRSEFEPINKNGYLRPFLLHFHSMMLRVVLTVKRWVFPYRVVNRPGAHNPEFMRSRGSIPREQIFWLYGFDLVVTIL